MHDPMTVAFEIKYPWRRKRPRPFMGQTHYRETFITVWHVDPNRGGNDDSCDWFGRNRPLTEDEQAIMDAIWNAESLFGNPPHFLSKYDLSEDVDMNDPPQVRPESVTSKEHDAFEEIRKAVRKWRHRKRRRLHPRWHVWHWRIQVQPLQEFKRWAFSRCAGCGRRFRWGYSPCTAQWHGKGPRWFRSEERTFHTECFPKQPSPMVNSLS